MQRSRGKSRRLCSVFYDLETTTKFNVGQILNYCFTLVDPELRPLRELSGRVRISPLELPAPGAILANRTDVLRHQETTSDTEPVAMGRIAEFLWGAIRECESVNLIGFNSARFDLQYLRTSLARLGINPYFGGRLVYRDLYHVAKKLAVSAPNFPRHRATRPRAGDEHKLSLSLETLARGAGILTEAQRHEAKADVDVTIALARYLRDTFDLDVTTYQPYEAYDYHQRPRSGEIVSVVEPQYDLNRDDGPVVIPMILLEGSEKSALWVDLERYRAGEGRQAIRWMNPATGRLACGAARDWGDYREAAAAALTEFGSLTTANYFAPTTCYIEEHIYRLTPPMIDALGRALERGDPAELSECEDGYILFRRARSAFSGAGLEGAEGTAWREATLKKYGLYRYGGKMLIERTPSGEAVESDYHPTLTAMCGELNELLGSAPSEEDRTLLLSLSAFYSRSEIVRLAGAELGFKP